MPLCHICKKSIGNEIDMLCVECNDKCELEINLDIAIKNRFDTTKNIAKMCNIDEETIILYLHYNGFTIERLHSKLKDSYEYTYFIKKVNINVRSEREIIRTDILDKLAIRLKSIIMSTFNKDRRSYEFKAEMNIKNIDINDYSNIYNWYVDGGIDKVRENIKNITDHKINSLDDIINVIDEIYFYDTKTGYNKIYMSIISNYKARYIKIDDCDIKLKAKKRALEQYLYGHDNISLPKYVAPLMDKSFNSQ